MRSLEFGLLAVSGNFLPSVGVKVSHHPPNLEKAKLQGWGMRGNRADLMPAGNQIASKNVYNKYGLRKIALIEPRINQNLKKEVKMSLLKKFTFVLVALAMLAALATPALAATTASRVYAKSVVEDKTVTLVGSSLLVNTRYNVYLSRYGKYPSGAKLVGFALTDAKGAFTKTFKIPGKLVDVAKIGVNLTSSNGDATSNWFINASSSSNTGGEGSPNFSFSVTSIKKNNWVKIKTKDLPANVTFDVRMGKAGSKGVNGTKVGELTGTKSGSVKATFDIPDVLEGKSQIDIRMENKSLGMSYYVTFDNK
jgi:hypothetical protein